MFRLLTVHLAFLLLGAGTSFSQGRPAPEDQIKLGQQFFAQEAKCRGLLRDRSWKEAEAACEESVRLADRFADHRELEKMGAYASVGHALMGQQRYRDAIRFYSRAIEVSRPRLDDTNAETGDMFVNMAVAHHLLRELDAAREWYRKAEKTYRTAHAGIREEEVTEQGAEMKRGYLKALRRVFELHLRAAQDAGAAAEVKEIEKQLADLH
jgi:tetratricopeptide (TPR) repeat protein